MLVATDIAARGIDVAEIGHVVNYDLPHVPADYVHRVGRTARAAASGRASSFCAPDEAGLLRDIERFTRKSISRSSVPRESPEFTQELASQPTIGRHPHPASKAGHAPHPRASQPRHPRASQPKHPRASQPKHAHASDGQPRPSQPKHPRASQPAQGSGTDGNGQPRKGLTVFRGGPRRR